MQTMQEIILALHGFWAQEGCFLAQPYDLEKGAGTMNPETFFRALGPEPWRVAYVEPSRRPADGRYGENPNRLYQHHQYQVVLKPAPDDVLDRYLRSLQAIGLDPEVHDIRFVEDNWEAPSLGAWGLGWEVWSDGMEITQFTYFQQMGGVELDPIACEMTYGLERIASYIQGVDSVYDVQLGGGLRYGDVFLASEQEQSRFSFDASDAALLRRHFEDNEAEAGRLATERLLRPGYDHLLRCSHLFNLLDARGAISVSERAALIGRLRTLARRFAEGYLEQRAELGHPLLGVRA